MVAEAREEIVGLKDGHGRLLLANQRTGGPDVVVKAEKGGVGLETLFRRPRKPFDDEPSVMVFAVGLLLQGTIERGPVPHLVLSV